MLKNKECSEGPYHLKTDELDEAFKGSYSVNNMVTYRQIRGGSIDSNGEVSCVYTGKHLVFSDWTVNVNVQMKFLKF